MDCLPITPTFFNNRGQPLDFKTFTFKELLIDILKWCPEETTPAIRLTCRLWKQLTPSIDIILENGRRTPPIERTLQWLSKLSQDRFDLVQQFSYVNKQDLAFTCTSRFQSHHISLTGSFPTLFTEDRFIGQKGNRCFFEMKTHPRPKLVVRMRPSEPSIMGKEQHFIENKRSDNNSDAFVEEKIIDLMEAGILQEQGPLVHHNICYLPISERRIAILVKTSKGSEKNQSLIFLDIDNPFSQNATCVSLKQGSLSSPALLNDHLILNTCMIDLTADSIILKEHGHNFLHKKTSVAGSCLYVSDEHSMSAFSINSENALQGQWTFFTEPQIFIKKIKMSDKFIALFCMVADKEQPHIIVKFLDVKTGALINEFKSYGDTSMSGTCGCFLDSIFIYKLCGKDYLTFQDILTGACIQKWQWKHKINDIHISDRILSILTRKMARESYSNHQVIQFELSEFKRFYNGPICLDK